MKKQVTTAQYAKMRGITSSGVTKAIRENRKMPNVEKVEKFGKFYLLTLKKPI